MVVPLIALDGVEPELLVAVDDPSIRNRLGLKYSAGTACIIGGDISTALTPHNYTLQQQMLFALSVHAS